MRVVAVQYLPQGQAPGTVVDLPEALATLFLKIGAVRALTDDASTAPAADTAAPKPARAGRYRRRDLRADA